MKIAEIKILLIWWVLILLILFIKSFLATELKSSFFLYHLFWRTCKQDQIYLIGWTTSFSFTGERGLTLSSPSHKLLRNIWDKVFKNGPSKVCRRQPLKNLKGYGLLWVLTHPQILLGPFLNTSSHMQFQNKKCYHITLTIDSPVSKGSFI